MHRVLSLFTMIMLIACGSAETGGSGATSSSAGSGGSDGSGGSTSSAGGSMSGAGGGGAVVEVGGESTTSNDCAPNDGKAYTVTIGLSAKTCDAAPGGDLLRFTFWTHVDSPAGNMWMVGAGGNGSQGIFQPNGDPSNIIAVKSGTLSITSWDMQGADGTYDVILNDGTHLAGSFKALGCLTNPTQCG